jgi:tetratricopeptide (TPR) repeat protein
MDDRPNIVNNYYLHINDLSVSTLYKTLYTNTHNPTQLKKKMYRPVACLTFALNWYVHQDRVFGYHLVNVAIHSLNAFLLFLVILLLFDTPWMKKHKRYAFQTAFFVSLLWAAHPIQIQAVTYIVQRMSSLATLFYILGMLCYLKARLGQVAIRRIGWVVFGLVFYILGFFSKENAVMLPASLVLIEILFFQNLSDKKTQKIIFLFLILSCAFTFLLATFLFLNGDPLSFLKGYGGRSFSFTERILAQPRVVVFYLYQIIFPIPQQFSIAHDVELSASVFKPWTTIPSILLIMALILAAFHQSRKRPLISFTIFFFFINHITESTVIPLEIIFEHRNYLPSLFLFLPVSFYLMLWMQKIKPFRANIYHGVILMILVCCLSLSTYVRNKDWENGITLWTAALGKAPENARALNTLAIKLVWSDESRHPRRYDLALELMERSLTQHIPRKTAKADIYSNMALVYFYYKNDPEKAFEMFEKALSIHPGGLKIRRDLASALIISGKYEKALAQTDILIQKNKNNGLYHNLNGLALLWQGNYQKAIDSFATAFNLLSNKGSVVLNSAVALIHLQRYENAEALLQECILRYPDDITFYMALIENHTRSGDMERAAQAADDMVNRFGLIEAESAVERYADNPKYAPLSKKIIAQIVRDVVR